MIVIRRLSEFLIVLGHTFTGTFEFKTRFSVDMNIMSMINPILILILIYNAIT